MTFSRVLPLFTLFITALATTRISTLLNPADDRCARQNCPPLDPEQGKTICTTIPGSSPPTNSLLLAAFALEQNPVYAPFLGTQPTRRRAYQKNDGGVTVLQPACPETGGVEISILGGKGENLLTEDIIGIVYRLAAPGPGIFSCVIGDRAEGEWIGSGRGGGSVEIRVGYPKKDFLSDKLTVKITSSIEEPPVKKYGIVGERFTIREKSSLDPC